MYICFWKLCTEKQQEKTKNKNWLCISRMCRICRCTLSSWKKLKLQKAVASNVEEAERTQRRGKPAETKHCDCDWDELAEGEINWQRVKERAQTTARKLHFLKRLPWTSGVWCVHLNRIFTGHKLFFIFFLLETKEKSRSKIKLCYYQIGRTERPKVMLSRQYFCSPMSRDYSPFWGKAMLIPFYFLSFGNS